MQSRRELFRHGLAVHAIRFFFSSRRRHTRFDCDWSSDVCSSDLDRGLSGRRRMLRIREVHAGYGATPILFGVSLEVREGEAVALLGRNGMGKTTLMGSEERRVGKEWRSRWGPDPLKKKRVSTVTG